MNFVSSPVAPESPVRSERWIAVGDSRVFVPAEGGLPEGHGVTDQAGEVDTPPIYLGSLGEDAYWAIGVKPPASLHDGDFVDLRRLASVWDRTDWALAGRAVQLVEWYRTNRFCGRCAAATEMATDERGMRCPACGLIAYPTVSPAVIVLVRKGPKALLGLHARSRGRMFSTLAGFVEPGETAEEAVRREILEEVGIAVCEPDYVASQSWPFPHSLMLAFTAEWESGEIAVDGNEIMEARWFDADELPDVPPSLSISGQLIEMWVQEAAAG